MMQATLTALVGRMVADVPMLHLKQFLVAELLQCVQGKLAAGTADSEEARDTAGTQDTPKAGSQAGSDTAAIKEV